MGATPNVTVGTSRAADSPRRRLDLCTPGFVDGFGERLLLFDAPTATSLELLRFKREFSESLAFEAALRDRVDQFKHVQDSAIAPVRAVDHFESEGLLLVSKHVTGHRLSELLPKSKGPAVAADMIRQVVPVLVSLAQAGRRFAHGALTLDRIITNHDGRLIVVEHALGTAVESLGWPGARLQSELGLAVPGGVNPVQFDARIDAIQLGLVALSLLVGRRLEPSDYPAKVTMLLDESADADGGGTWAASRLRTWLERALQVGPRALESVRDAQASLGELPNESEFRRGDRTIVAFTSPPAAAAPQKRVADIAPPSKPAPAAHSPAPAAPSPAPASTAHVTELRAFATQTPAVQTPAVHVPAVQAPTVPPPAAKEYAALVAAPADTYRTGGRSWAFLSVSGLAIAEALVIVGLLYFRPQAAAVVPSAAAETTSTPPAAPAPVAAAPQPFKSPVSAAPVVPNARADASASQSSTAPAPDAAARAAERFGGITLTSAIELQVYEGGRLIGSTAGPIALIEGVHTLDLVNDGLGYRSRETVAVKPGQLAARTIPVPNGRISINAAPWADVSIDGTAAGQTPLANLSIAIGQHEIVFRHPQFPEQRQTIVVKSDGLTRVSASMQR